MLKLALGTVMAGVAAFSAVAFWPSSEPSRAISLSVVQPASTSETIDAIEGLLKKSEDRAGTDMESSDNDGEVRVASLETETAVDEPIGFTDDSTSFDAETSPEEPPAPEAESDTDAAISDETDQTVTDSGDTQEKHPAPPVRKPLAKAQPAPTSYSLLEKIAEIGPGAIARIEEKFNAAGVAWPPQRLAYLAFKDEKVIEVQAQSADGKWAPVYRYPILRASGSSGPKLREGDAQVPEGLYKIALLNPNSKYHVSLRVSYPNDFDRAMAKAEGRKKLGGDIMIHGSNRSIGCLAVGDPASEEFFVMAHIVGLENLDVIIAPRDFRKPSMLASMTETINFGEPSWVPKLYEDIKGALKPFPELPPEVSPSIAQR
ncbi:MAG: hypothetical protein U1E49_13705 [Hyphomicrobiaceae bacterium]